MTEKLYLSDAYLGECAATVTDISERGNKYAVVLDRTCFFPEGGGQPSDAGHINGTEIVCAVEENGTVYHFAETTPDFAVGETVKCTIDREKRFARMQAHSGEHILSGIVHSEFGFENVGFHMDDTLMTVDFDGFLTREQLYTAELKANRAVYENVPIKTYMLSEHPEITEYRSKLPELTNPRIVEIVGYDFCACCAPHVSSAGEIGLIKILSSASHRGGVRITVLCGVSAFGMLSSRYNDILEIADLLCAPHDATPSAVSDLLVRVDSLKREIALQKESAVKRIAESQNRTDGNICLFDDGLSPDDLRKLSVMLRDKCGGVCAVLSGNDDSGYAYAVTSPFVKLRSISGEMNGALSGRGGGKDDMLQGRFAAKKHDIEKYFSSEEFKNR